MQKENVVKGFKYLIGIIFTAMLIILPSEIIVHAEKEELDIDSFSGLVISEDARNDVDDIKIMITDKEGRDRRADVPITRLRWNGRSTQYQGNDDIRTSFFHHYLKGEGTGKILMEFPETNDLDGLLDYVVKIEYPVVGYIENDDLERHEIGANVTIDSIDKSTLIGSKLGSWDSIPIIDISTTLFSGMVYNNISAADWHFEFFYTDTGELVNFDEAYESVMTFNSLNGHTYNNRLAPEFVREETGKDAFLSRDTMIKRGNATEYYNNIRQRTYSDVYYGSHNDFDDWLGSNNFHISSAQYDLSGTDNTFKVGTAKNWNVAWFAFSSAKIDAPYKHKIPIKTVQPIQQYTSTDVPANPTGEESGFNQRYYNDLDIYQIDNGQSEVPDIYRVEGHDPDRANELTSGVPNREERHIEKGQEFYYFINQKTIHIGADGVISPTGYRIEDKLPEGVVLTDHPFTLYNLDGSHIDLENLDRDDYSGKESFSLRLSDNQTRKINELAKRTEYYGEDFSLRVRVKATEDIKSNQLVINQASTSFTYFDSDDPDDTVSQKSNHVAVKTKINTTKIEFDKVNQDEKALPNAVFKIYEYDENKSENKGKLLDTKTSDSKGKVTFNYDFPPGKYVLEEFHAPGQYMLHEDVVIEVDDNLQVIWPDGLDGKIVNEKRYNLWLFKVDEHRNPLKGAKFELSGGDLDEPRIETSDKDGEIIFRAGPMFKGQTYELRELEAPAGYDKVDTVYKIEMSDEGLSANLIDGEGNKSPLKVELIEDVSKHNKVSGGIEIGIVNPRTKSTLEVIKEDKDSKKAIKDVSFKVFKEGENPDKAIEYTTDEQGKFTVPNLDTKETYFIRETKAPNDYILLDQDIVLSFDTKQNKWLVTEKDTGKELDEVKWDSQNNLLSVTVFNEQKKMLPQTGGSGIIIPLVISSLTGLGSLSYFIRFKRSEV